MSEIAPVRFRALGAVNRTKTSLFNSKLIISAPARIRAPVVYFPVCMGNVCVPVSVHDVYQGDWMCQCGCRVSGDMSTPCQLKPLGEGQQWLCYVTYTVYYTFFLGNVSSIRLCLEFTDLLEELTKSELALTTEKTFVNYRPCSNNRPRALIRTKSSFLFCLIS